MQVVMRLKQQMHYRKNGENDVNNSFSEKYLTVSFLVTLQ